MSRGFGAAALGIYALMHTSGLEAKSAPQPSRPAPERCAWKPFESKELGVRLLVEECPVATGGYVYSVKGRTLEQHRPSDDRKFISSEMLEVFTKPAAQTIEKAIEKQFVSKLDPKARRGCRVRPLEKPPARLKTAKAGVLRFEIAPFGGYAKEIGKELEEGPRDFGCGAYGKNQPYSYFEYHPDESKTRFFHTSYWDEPLFDELSVELFGEAPLK